jgi:TorA maturation chaperone TorD
MSPRIPAGNGRLRTNMYALLAVLLSQPPTHATLQLLKDIRPGREAEVGALGPCWADLRAASVKFTCGQLDEEYHRLFVGLGRGEVIPYGSWYLGGRLMDKPLARLRGDLAALGIERRSENRESEDHAASLCATMALISDPDASVPRERLRMFFHDHLATWMPRFFRDLLAAPSARFYLAVGRTGEAFMQREEQTL